MENIRSEGKCNGVGLKIEGTTFNVEVHVLVLIGCDMKLGMALITSIHSIESSGSKNIACEEKYNRVRVKSQGTIFIVGVHVLILIGCDTVLGI